jgi:hypothetical protein
VNARQARELKGVLGVVYPRATEIEVRPDSDGALIVISGIGAGGNADPGSDDVRMSIGNGDGPVLRMLLSGYVR